MKYVLKKADQTEVEEIFSLYLKRIQWMNEKGINQYYESMVYEMAGTCKDGGDEGNRREKYMALL